MLALMDYPTTTYDVSDALSTLGQKRIKTGRGKKTTEPDPQPESTTPSGNRVGRSCKVVCNVDIFEDKENGTYTFLIEIPGYQEPIVNYEYSENALTVTATPSDSFSGIKRPARLEFYNFEREILPEESEAFYKSGILKIRIPIEYTEPEKHRIL